MSVPINPKLPANFDSTPNEDRPRSQLRWWHRPYIQTFTCEPGATEEARARWFKSWPGGTRYDVRCLDGGAWDRPTWWGSFATLEEAIAAAGGGSPHRERSKDIRESRLCR